MAKSEQEKYYERLNENARRESERLRREEKERQKREREDAKKYSPYNGEGDPN